MTGMAIHLEVPDKPEWSQRQLIVDRLDAYNDAQTYPEPDRALCVLLHSDDAVVGGLWGRTYYRWLFIEQFFVPEELRGRGVGSELLTKAEQEALERGCHGVWLETFTFQAPGFYKRHGFEIFGVIDDYPPGHSRIFFRKRLDGRRRQSNG